MGTNKLESLKKQTNMLVTNKNRKEKTNWVGTIGYQTNKRTWWGLTNSIISLLPNQPTNQSQFGTETQNLWEIDIYQELTMLYVNHH